MPHVLEIKGGDYVTPRNIFDLMDTIEDYMGADVRQYLEEYLEGDTPEEATPEEHYQEVLGTLEDRVLEIENAIGGKRTDKKSIQQSVGAMKKILMREMKVRD